MNSIPKNLIIILSVVCIYFPTQVFSHSWMAPKDEAQKENLVESTNESIEQGKQIYENQCAYCHGDGASGLSKKQTELSQDTPNLVKRLKNHTEGDFHWKILNGKDEMPSFKESLSEKEVWDILNYLKTLTE